MLKKIIACAAFAMTLTCATAFAAEYDGYIVEIAEDTPARVELASVENTGAEKIIDNMYLVDTLEEAENFVDEKYIVNIMENIKFELYSSDQPNDYYYSRQWPLHNTNMPTAWRAGLTGDGVKIAVADSGLTEHEDMNMDKVVYRYNLVDDASDKNDVTDTNGHGTAVAGIIAAQSDNGKGVASIAPNADLAIIKITEGSSLLFDKVISALDIAVEQKCDIINLSLGSSNLTEKQIKDTQDEFTKAQQKSLEKNGKDLIIIAASGNDALKGNPVSYPAAFDNVVGVGSVDKNNVRSAFSQYYKGVDIAAPGGSNEEMTSENQFDQILTLSIDPVHPYLLGRGTSYAAPFVTGVTALAVEAAHKADKQITTETLLGGEGSHGLLERSATDLGDPGKDDEYGWGVIDADKMIHALYQDGYISALPATPAPTDTPDPDTTPEPDEGTLQASTKISENKITTEITYNSDPIDNISIIGALYDNEGNLIKVEMSDKHIIDAYTELVLDTSDVDRKVKEHPGTYKILLWQENYKDGIFPITAIKPEIVPAWYTPSPTETPVPETSASPIPEVSVSPEPETSASPEPETSVSPEPETSVAPEPETSVAPEPETSISPEPETSISPEPETSISPEPETSISPEPETSVSPEPETSVSPEPETSVSPEPETSVSPEPETSVSPEPETGSGTQSHVSRIMSFIKRLFK